jgi:hypothetical protein
MLGPATDKEEQPTLEIWDVRMPPILTSRRSPTAGDHQVYRAGAGQAVVVLPLEAIGRGRAGRSALPANPFGLGVLRSLPGRAIGPVRPRQAGAR